MKFWTSFKLFKLKLLSIAWKIRLVSGNYSTMESGIHRDLLSWFQNNGGVVDLSSMDIITFPSSEGGQGAVAVKDIPVCSGYIYPILFSEFWLLLFSFCTMQEGHVLFTIPRALTLSTRTSTLPSRFGAEQWKDLKMDDGWVGLILCMMWEAAMGSSSKWSAYLGADVRCYLTTGSNV